MHDIEKREKAVKLRKRGMSLRKIGARLGISAMAVLYWTDDEYRKKQRASSVKYAASPKGQDFYLKRIYGISLEDYMLMFERQNGRCAICSHVFDIKYKKNIHVDHCHRTGKVRGLLCSLCNAGLGNFKDNQEFLRNAASYLDLF